MTMQRGNYQKKLAAMRAYAKTPAGKASKKASQARFIAKRRGCASAINKLKVKPQALITALANWR